MNYSQSEQAIGLANYSCILCINNVHGMVGESRGLVLGCGNRDWGWD